MKRIIRPIERSSVHRGLATRSSLQSQPHLRPAPPLHYQTTLEPPKGTESTQQLTDNDIFHDIDLCQEICLMMRVTWNNGKALPIFSFTERQIVEKYKQLIGLEPVALTLMGPHDVLLEFDKKADVMGSSQKIHGSKTWDGMGTNHLIGFSSCTCAVFDVIGCREAVMHDMHVINS